MNTVPAVDPADFTDDAIAKLAPACGECGPGTVVDMAQGQIIYPNRPDLWSQNGMPRWWWLCASCGAYVGVHPGTFKPLGSPAGRETRAARTRAHAAFDPMWKRAATRDGLNPNRARAHGYKWLAAQLGIERKDCHIGMMSRHDADRVTALCARYGR